MELKIDVSDRDEVAAAITLLQTILGAAAGNAVHVVSIPASVPPAPPTAPVPPPPAAAPAAPQTASPPASAPSPTASSVELDKNGLPWDERIHASTKSKLASGEWKNKRGVDAALVTQVEAELRARVAASVPAPGTPANWPFAPGSSAGEQAPAAADPAAVFGGNPPAGASAPFAPPAAPSVPAPPAAPSVVADPTTFETLMPRVSAAIAAGTLSADAIQRACTARGLASVVTLQSAPDWVPYIWADLKALYPALA